VSIKFNTISHIKNKGDIVLNTNTIITTIKQTYPELKNYTNQDILRWFESLSVVKHDEAFQTIKTNLLQKELYKDIDIVSILNLGEISNKLVQRYDKSTIIEAMVEDSLSNVIVPSGFKSDIGLAIFSLVDEL